MTDSQLHLIAVAWENPNHLRLPYNSGLGVTQVDMIAVSGGKHSFLQLLSGEAVARPSLPGSDLLVREELAIDRTVGCGHGKGTAGTAWYGPPMAVNCS